MKANTLEQAIQAVDYTFLSPSAPRAGRAATLLAFANEQGVSIDDVIIEENNNWSKPPKPASTIAYRRLGGTTFKYQVWAVLRPTS